MPDPHTFNRAERNHIEALQKRLDHLVEPGQFEERRNNPAYPPGEAKALAWVMAVLEGSETPLLVRLERIELNVKKAFQRIGAIERDLDAEVVDDDGRIHA